MSFQCCIVSYFWYMELRTHTHTRIQCIYLSMHMMTLFYGISFLIELLSDIQRNISILYSDENLKFTIFCPIFLCFASFFNGKIWSIDDVIIESNNNTMNVDYVPSNAMLATLDSFDYDMYLFKKYVIDGSDLQINIPSETKKDLTGFWCKEINQMLCWWMIIR